jgi:hypothetical protein
LATRWELWVQSKQELRTNSRREQMHAWARKTFRPLYDKVKTPSAKDTADRKQLRATLFATLVSAKDPKPSQKRKSARRKISGGPSFHGSHARPDHGRPGRA